MVGEIYHEDFEFHWSWRSAAAIVYLAICLVDLMIMPLYREYSYNRISATEIVTIAQRLPDGATQIEALRILKEDRKWEPVTNEMFHLSFAAILGVSALPGNRKGSGFVRRKKDKNLPEDTGEEGGTKAVGKFE